MKTKILLGVTIDGELAFADFELKNGPNNYDRQLSVCFDTVKPFDKDSIDEDYVRDYLSGLDKETLYDLCNEYDCSPRCLPEEYFSEVPVDEIVDCSLYPGELEVNGVEYLFESCGCGQIDLDGEMALFTDEGMFCELYGLWKHFHLKLLSPNTFAFINETLNRISKKSEDIDEKQWIAKYLEGLQKEER